MPFFQVVDELTDNPKFQKLFHAAMHGDIIGPAAVSLWVAAGSKSQRALTDGVVSLEMCVSVFLNPDLVNTLADRLVEVGLWHAPGHSCSRCVDPPEGAWVFHDWFDIKYEAGELVKITRGKRAELKDRKVTAAVWARDRIGEPMEGGNMIAPCRYCGNCVRKLERNTWQYDHVDPTLYIGAANIVIACTDCNKRKQQRTPQEAGMVLHRPGWKKGDTDDWQWPPVDRRQEALDCAGVVETVVEEERPADARVSGPVDAYLPNVDSHTVSACAAGEETGASDLQKHVRQKCGTNEPAAAATKRLSTRARAGQGRAGQGKPIQGKDGSNQGQAGTSQGGVPQPQGARKRRRRKKTSQPRSPLGIPSSGGLAGPAPEVPMGGRFGSPWMNWSGKPPEVDDAICPEHGEHVPCGFCSGEEWD